LRKTVSGMMLALLLISMLLSTFNVQPVKGMAEVINSEGKDKPQGYIKSYVSGRCGKDYRLVTPTKAQIWTVNITIVSEWSNQSVHIWIYEVIGDYPYDCEKQIDAPHASGTGHASLVAQLNTSKTYEVWIRDAYARHFTGYIEESWSSTSLSLEPIVIRVPFLELDNASVTVSVNLDIKNIHNLKNFTLIFTFNNKMLEYYTQYAGDWGYSGSRSTNPRYNVLTVSGELSDGREISGSGTFLTFAFKVLSIGVSNVSLEYAYLEDKYGSVIPYTISRNNVTVEVLPLEVWVDEKYVELKQEYDGLLENYTNLEAEYRDLNSTYHNLLAGYYSLNSTLHILLSNFIDLQGKYATLSSDYEDLLEDFKSLNTALNDLQTKYGLLNSTYYDLNADYKSLNQTYHNYVETHSYSNSEYETLQSNYQTLESNYKSLQSGYESLTDNFAMAKNLNYILTITTATFIATTVYFVKRKPKIP